MVRSAYTAQLAASSLDGLPAGLRAVYGTLMQDWVIHQNRFVYHDTDPVRVGHLISPRWLEEM